MSVLTLESLAEAFATKDAQIERLREENAHFAWRDADKNKLITELCDALSYFEPLNDNAELIQRAREATR